MGKIFCLMGKSSSGKDTVYKILMAEDSLGLHTIVPCTTRPIRDGECHGVEYFFYSEEELLELEKAGKIIELRSYHTVHGTWKYFTADDGNIHLEKYSYLVIGTLESYRKLQEYFGRESLVPIYLQVDDGIRLQRALNRERDQESPKYHEMCRRFLADEEDFSEKKLASAGIVQRFQNDDLNQTVENIISFISKETKQVPEPI